MTATVARTLTLDRDDEPRLAMTIHGLIAEAATARATIETAGGRVMHGGRMTRIECQCELCRHARLETEEGFAIAA